jgi:hypothetical protein
LQYKDGSRRRFWSFRTAKDPVACAIERRPGGSGWGLGGRGLPRAAPLFVPRAASGKRAIPGPMMGHGIAHEPARLTPCMLQAVHLYISMYPRSSSSLPLLISSLARRRQHKPLSSREKSNAGRAEDFIYSLELTLRHTSSLGKGANLFISLFAKPRISKPFDQDLVSRLRISGHRRTPKFITRSQLRTAGKAHPIDSRILIYYTLDPSTLRSSIPRRHCLKGPQTCRALPRRQHRLLRRALPNLRGRTGAEEGSARQGLRAVSRPSFAPFSGERDQDSFADTFLNGLGSPTRFYLG